jgi:hypothetical protein
VSSRSLRRAALAGGLGLGLVLAGCAAGPLPPPPMPPDLKVVAPPPSVSRENARFAGRWIGKWEEQLEHVLVVELVVQNEQAAEVVAVYAWGVSAELGVGTPGWSRVRGRIENGILRLELTRVQATAVYTMQADGTVMGEYWRGDKVTSRVRLTRAVREGPGL